MTIKQCYQAMGADFEEISQRIPSEAMIRKFAVKFPEDKSFAELTKALEQGDVETAFRAAHTLKGVCANLGLEKLLQSAGGLTEELRPEQDKIPAEAFSWMEELRRDYRTAEDAISQLLTEK